MRGKLSDDVQALAQEYLGREIDTTELRLYPYLDYVMKNEQYIDIRRINGDDRRVLSRLRSAGHIDYHTDPSYIPARMFIQLSKPFYDYINQVLWRSYVVGAYVEVPV